MSFQEIVCDIDDINLKKLSVYIPKKKKTCYSMSILYKNRPLCVRFPLLEMTKNEKFDTIKFTLPYINTEKIDNFVDAIKNLITKEVKEILDADNTKHKYFSPINKKREIRIKENQYTNFVNYDKMKHKADQDVEVEALVKLTKYEDEIFISFWGRKIDLLSVESDGSDGCDSDEDED